MTVGTRLQDKLPI